MTSKWIIKLSSVVVLFIRVIIRFRWLFLHLWVCPQVVYLIGSSSINEILVRIFLNWLVNRINFFFIRFIHSLIIKRSLIFLMGWRRRKVIILNILGFIVAFFYSYRFELFLSSIWRYLLILHPLLLVLLL